MCRVIRWAIQSIQDKELLRRAILTELRGHDTALPGFTTGLLGLFFELGFQLHLPLHKERVDEELLGSQAPARVWVQPALEQHGHLFRPTGLLGKGWRKIFLGW